VTVAGAWLCYAPGAFDRQRNYGVLTGPGATWPPAILDAFIVHAEELRGKHVELRAVESWQYIPMQSDGPVALLRCAYAERDGVQAAVVFALVLPDVFVKSDDFRLAACAKLFPPSGSAATSVPAPAALDGLADNASIEPEAKTLAAACLAGTRIGVSPPAEALPRFFCRVVEALPPADRMGFSFSTLPVGEHDLEAHPGAPAPHEIVPDADALVRALLWEMLWPGLDESTRRSVSIRHVTGLWLLRGDTARDVGAAYLRVVELIEQRLSEDVRAAARQRLRAELETKLFTMSAEEAARLLVVLHNARFLTRDRGVPPIWLARVASSVAPVGELPHSLLREILRPEALAVLGSSNAIEPSTKRVESLLALLQAYPADDTAPAMLAACEAAAKELNQERFGERHLARAWTVLGLERHARLGPKPYRGMCAA
jgi:hypothetical protein